MESLFESNIESQQITVYIVEDQISEANKTRLKEISGRFGRKVVFIPAPTQADVYPGVRMNLGRTYLRMSLGEILPPDVDRVLSLDSDTLVLDSLNEMYETDFGEEEYVAGVYDCVGRAIQKRILHAPDDLYYCNAGVFLIDLSKWRRIDVGKQLMNAVLENADGKRTMYFLEQDIMNLVFYQHLKLLHPRYNLLTSIYLFRYNEIIKMKKPVRYYEEDTICAAKNKPAILHATTCFYVRKRMWVENSDHPYSRFYIDYRCRTPWKNDAMIQDMRCFRKKCFAKFWHCMPHSWAVSLADISINYFRPIWAEFSTKVNISTIATQSST